MPEFVRYTVSLDADSVAALDHASERTGLTKATILRSLIFAYCAGAPLPLPEVTPHHAASVSRIKLAKTNGLSSL